MTSIFHTIVYPGEDMFNAICRAGQDATRKIGTGYMAVQTEMAGRPYLGLALPGIRASKRMVSLVCQCRGQVGYGNCPCIGLGKWQNKTALAPTWD